jgi:tetratricopeptide (TPR) repeat protein
MSSVWATYSPDNIEVSLGLRSELVRLSQELGDPALEAHERGAMLDLLLENGDRDAYDREFEAHEQLVKALRGQPYRTWMLAVNQTRRALFEGRFAEAGDFLQHAMKLGQEAKNKDAMQSSGGQLLFMQREQGGLSGMADAVKGFAEQYRAFPLWRCVLAWVLAEVGRAVEARQELDSFAANGFADLPRNHFWLASLWCLSEAAGTLDDVPSATTLYEILLPYARRCSVVPVAVCAGSTSRSLGLLATTLSRFRDAARHFDDAMETNARMRATPWLAYTQYDYGRMLLRRDEPGDREKAAALVAKALGTAQTLGMKPLSEKATVLKLQLEALAAEDKAKRDVG